MLNLGSLKFSIKVKIVANLRSLFLFFFGSHPARNGWSERLLIIYLEAIGDTVALTSILKHLKNAYSGKKIYFLVNKDLGLDDLIRPFIDEFIPLNYKSFILNPISGFLLVNKLRKIGFETVLSPDHSPAEFTGKLIAVNLGAKNIIGYEGFLLPFQKPFNRNMEQNVKLVISKIYPRFTKVIPSLDRDRLPEGGLNSTVNHYIKFYESATGRREVDYSTQITIPPESGRKISQILRKNEIESQKFAVLNLGSSQPWKNWPVERFLQVFSFMSENKIPIVLVGSRKERILGLNFETNHRGQCLNLVGQINISETAALIESCLLVLANDTAPIHIGIALKKPTLCVLGGGHFGKISLYGYPDINLWVYKRMPCFCDNWQCVVNLKKGTIAPCIDAISTEQVSESLKKLIAYLEKTPNYPKQKFMATYLK